MDSRSSLSDANESVLIALSQSNGPKKEQALAELLRRNESLIQAICHDCYGSDNVRDDALQGGRLGFLESVKLYRDGNEASLATYAHKRVRGRARREARKCQKFKEVPTDEPMEYVTAVSPSAEDDYMAGSSWGMGELGDAIARLSVTQQRLLNLRILREMSFSQIAQIEGSSASAVRQRFLTVLKILRGALETNQDRKVA